MLLLAIRILTHHHWDGHVVEGGRRGKCVVDDCDAVRRPLLMVQRPLHHQLPWERQAEEPRVLRWRPRFPSLHRLINYESVRHFLRSVHPERCYHCTCRHTSVLQKYWQKASIDNMAISSFYVYTIQVGAYQWRRLLEERIVHTGGRNVGVGPLVPIRIWWQVRHCGAVGNPRPRHEWRTDILRFLPRRRIYKR